MNYHLSKSERQNELTCPGGLVQSSANDVNIQEHSQGELGDGVGCCRPTFGSAKRKHKAWSTMSSESLMDPLQVTNEPINTRINYFKINLNFRI